MYITRNFSEEHPNEHLNEFFEKDSNNVSMFNIFEKYNINIYVQEKKGSEKFREISSKEEIFSPKIINIVYYANNYNGML